MRGQKGFTLVELIVVIAIIAILAAVAIPNFIGLQNRAQRGVDIANATAIASAMNMYNLTATEKLDASYVETLAAFSTVKNKIGDLWPRFDDDDKEEVLERALARITYDDDGVFVVNKKLEEEPTPKPVQ